MLRAPEGWGSYLGCCFSTLYTGQTVLQQIVVLFQRHVSNNVNQHTTRYLKTESKYLRLLYLHDRMKKITVLVVDNDHRNNLVKFEKDSPFYF